MQGREKGLSKPKRLLWALSILNQADQEKNIQANSCSEGGSVAPLPGTCPLREASITLRLGEAGQCQVQQCQQRSLDICRDAQQVPSWSLRGGALAWAAGALGKGSCPWWREESWSPEQAGASHSSCCSVIF